MGAADGRIAGLLGLERAFRGAAALEHAQFEAGWEGAIAWRRFDRGERWLFEAVLGLGGELDVIAGQAEDIMRAARETGITALCCRARPSWSVEQFLHATLRVPISRVGGEPRLDEVKRSLHGHAGVAALSEEFSRYGRAGGIMSEGTFDDMTRQHMAKCTVSDLEVLLLPQLRPIAFYCADYPPAELDNILADAHSSLR
jgi:hypothetical protein